MPKATKCKCVTCVLCALTCHGGRIHGGGVGGPNGDGDAGCFAVVVGAHKAFNEFYGDEHVQLRLCLEDDERR